MFVYCGECYNHYDDSYQTPDCEGPGASKKFSLFGSHQVFATQPVVAHMSNTRFVTMEHNLGKAPAAGQDGSLPVAPVVLDQLPTPPVTGR